jgi:mevalonate kinase
MNAENIQRFYSNGKLLITGEYLVLHGALALAVPTRMGQHLYVHSGQPDGLLHWKTTVQSAPRLSCSIDPVNWEILETDNWELSSGLVRILETAALLAGQADWARGVVAVSEIGFEMEWGLGSSSSLISNIAWWTGLDPFSLFRHVSNGSGYDIAAARSAGPIFYRRSGDPHLQPEVKPASFAPDYMERLAFVYLGRKQDSASSVRKFLDHALVSDRDIENISGLSGELTSAATLEEYELLLDRHEQVLSALLDRPPVKDVLFRDFPGAVKSLGAWGGDFIHVSLRTSPETGRQYFREKGFGVFIPFREMVRYASAEPVNSVRS